MRISKMIIGATVWAFLAGSDSLASMPGERGQSATGRCTAIEARAAAGEFHPGQLLVRFKPGVTRAGRQAVHAVAGAKQVLRDYHVVTGLQLVEVAEDDLPAALGAYKAHPQVLYAERDHIVYPTAIPNDTDFGELWGLYNTGQTVAGDPGTAGADIRAPQAWDFWTGDPNFRIAVIDTGVDYNHPDLAANIWTNPDEDPGDANGDGCPGVCGVDDDGDGLIDEDSAGRQPGEPDYCNDLLADDDENGYADDIHGYDFKNEDGDPMDDNRHGTHVSGTIGAVANNNEGIVGVNWHCKIVALKFIGGTG